MKRKPSRIRPDDRGAATVQMVLVVPIMVMLLLVTVQFALAWHADHLAQAAASQALAAARAQHGSAADGQAAGRATLYAIAGKVLTDATLSVHRTANSASATVRGRAISVLPWLPVEVEGHAAGPADDWSQPEGSGS